MDENNPKYRMQAPGAADFAPAWRLPERGFPRVDDHRRDIDFRREEMIGGRRIEAMPAGRDHGVQQVRLDRVIDSYVAEGYEAASDLKTRFDEESDFASDTAILKKGVDPQTGTRHLEKVAFEIVSKQRRALVTEKTQRMIRRGVERVFAIFVKKGEVAEWSTAEKQWVTLHPSSSIEDDRLVAPIPVKALLNVPAADNAVASALVAKGNPVIQEIESRSKAEGKAEGEVRGQAVSILKILEARGIAPGEALREQILETTDPDVLDRWIARVALVSSADALLDEV